ncbi:hypothetical protein AVEN_98132-1 [Araneus ventricosus]|uniref:Uncharacterized protein n=1 Tax=Araneus ventricosus TaxID=182803 RepID=A0A4Y2DDX9_ARAVE|nr:hypothetical protein AVEN_98132-1 [Araneus ventricosus]
MEDMGLSGIDRTSNLEDPDPQRLILTFGIRQNDARPYGSQLLNQFDEHGTLRIRQMDGLFLSNPLTE